jgi:hypothetical protein
MTKENAGLLGTAVPGESDNKSTASAPDRVFTVSELVAVLQALGPEYADYKVLGFDNYFRENYWISEITVLQNEDGVLLTDRSSSGG